MWVFEYIKIYQYIESYLFLQRTVYYKTIFSSQDGKKIDFSDPRFEQKQDKDGRIQLIIKPCVMDDEATYEAKVGTKKTSCKFRVKGWFCSPRR